MEKAVKYSHQGGEIRVLARPEGNRLGIGIADRGVGISLQDQAKLFGPFQRLEDSRLEGVKGVGWDYWYGGDQWKLMEGGFGWNRNPARVPPSSLHCR